MKRSDFSSAIMRPMAFFSLLAMAGLLAFGAAASAADKPSGQLAAFVIHDQPKPAPELKFAAEDGTARTLDDWRGRAVLLNLWATWCAPCKHEMPQLDNLQAILGSDTFEVVAVSLDRSGFNKPKRFYTKAGIANLALYNDKSMRLGSTLGATGMPTTVMFNAQGEEIGRLTGPAVWDSDEAVAFLKGLVTD